MIQNLIRLVRNYAAEQKERWKIMLPMFEVALNCSPYTSTGYPPNVVAFRWLPRLSLDLAFLADEEEAPPPPLSYEPPTSEWVNDFQQHLALLAQSISQNQGLAAQRQ